MVGISERKLTVDEQVRSEIIGACWTACGQAIDYRAILFILDSTSKLGDEQLRQACMWAATHPRRPGQSVLQAVMDAIDPVTRQDQRKADDGREWWCIPAVAIDHTRRKTQIAILLRHKLPASQAHWREEELSEIRRELEADSPSLAEHAQTVLERLAAHNRITGAMAKPRVGYAQRNAAMAQALTPREPGEEG